MRSAPMIDGRRPRLDDHEARPGMAVPPEASRPARSCSERTWRSEALVVFMLALHAPIVPFVSMRPKLPTPKTVGFDAGGWRRQDGSGVHGDAQDNDKGEPRPISISSLLLPLSDEVVTATACRLSTRATASTLRGGPRIGNVRTSELSRAGEILTAAGARAPCASARRAWRRHGTGGWRPSARRGRAPRRPPGSSGLRRPERRRGARQPSAPPRACARRCARARCEPSRPRSRPRAVRSRRAQPRSPRGRPRFCRARLPDDAEREQCPSRAEGVSDLVVLRNRLLEEGDRRVDLPSAAATRPRHRVTCASTHSRATRAASASQTSRTRIASSIRPSSSRSSMWSALHQRTLGSPHPSAAARRSASLEPLRGRGRISTPAARRARGPPCAAGGVAPNCS